MTKPSSSPTPWHRLLGLFLSKTLEHLPLDVHLEKDLSVQQQFLDILILTQKGLSEQDRAELPDGFDNLRQHNLISYKSHHESFDDWSLQELIGHYVSYRKLVSPKPNRLLSEDHFGLYGISTQFPRNLARSVGFEKLQKGVYNVRIGKLNIRLLVLRQMPLVQRNALWQIFSANNQHVSYGLAQFDPEDKELKSLLARIYQIYYIEGIPMKYSLDDIIRENVRHGLHLLTPQEVLQTFPAKDLIQQLSSQELINILPIRELINQLSPEYVASEAFDQAFLRGQRTSILNMLKARFTPSEERMFAIEGHLSTLEAESDLQALLLRAVQVETLEAFLLELSPSQEPKTSEN